METAKIILKDKNTENETFNFNVQWASFYGKPYVNTND